MKKEYNLDLIRDYVEGNDIEEYSIDELENDYKFMISVIKYTNDKNMYDLCSDSVKYNYEFVKFMINYFKDDMVFIDKVADNYIFGHKDINIYDDSIISLNYIDIILDMVDFNKDNIEHFNKWYLFAKLFYARCMGIATLVVKEEKLEREFGKGFYVIEKEFGSNTRVLDFFAINLINDELFNNDSFDLEKEMHKRYDSFDDIEDQGLNNYMVNIISGFDKYLSGYVSSHLDNLDNLREVLMDVKDNWNKFLEDNERLRYEVIMERVHDYIMYSEPYCTLGELEALYYVGYELGISDKIKEVEGMNDEDYLEIMGDREFIVRGMSCNERIHYNNIKKIMCDVLSERIIDESLDNYTNDNKKNTSKVLRLNEIKKHKNV